MIFSYTRKAEALAFLHGAWVLLGIVSLPLLFLIDGYYKISGAFIIINLGAWFIWKGCPLRIWENENKAKAGIEAYETTFTAYYLKKFFGLTVSPASTKIAIYIYIGLMLIGTIYKFI